MSINKIWTKLFTKNDISEQIELHAAGATVRHHNPFQALEVPRNQEELSQEVVDRWIIPFYMSIPVSSKENEIELFATASKQIDIEVIKLLLGDFDWRSRITGAYFAAIRDYKHLDDLIGRHLVKSEVCYAGSGYCLALASFGTESSKDFLQSYLAYYLERKDLWFDQPDALCALEYLDREAAHQFRDKWQDFIFNKPNWNLESARKYFLNSIEMIKKIRQQSLG